MCMLCFLALLFSIFLMKNQIFVKIMILYVYGSIQVFKYYIMKKVEGGWLSNAYPCLKRWQKIASK